MQDLHRNPPARLIHAVGDNAVVFNILIRKQPRRTRKHPTFTIGRHAAGHHQPDATARASGIKFRHTVPIAGFFEPCVHRPHKRPIFQGDMAKIKWGQQVGIGHRLPPISSKDDAASAPCHPKRRVTLLRCLYAMPPEGPLKHIKFGPQQIDLCPQIVFHGNTRNHREML